MKEFEQPLIVKRNGNLGTRDRSLLCAEEVAYYFATTEAELRGKKIVAVVTDKKPADRPALAFKLRLTNYGRSYGVNIDERTPLTLDALDAWLAARFGDYRRTLYVSFSVDGVWLELREGR